jgi:P-type Cu+ transporter
MGDPLRPLPGLLRLSRQLVLNIRQSIYIFAFGMNGLGMLLCAWGILSPTGGAVFHEFASIAVMLNAMRLLWFERWEDTRMGRLSASLGQTAQWLTETFSPAQIIYRFLNSWAVLLRLAVASLLLSWFVSGVVLLSPGEQALVTRYGRYHETLDAGWHWRWPVPLERVYRERTEHIRTVQLGFRASGAVNSEDDLDAAPVEWTSEHDDERYQAVTSESLVLVADEIPVELTAEVHYRIADLYQYVYGGAATEDTLRAAAESSIRQVAARETLDGILTDRRQQIETACLDSVRRMIAGYGLGVEITDLHLLDIHPPKAVVPAYRDAANALEERERAVNDAETYYARRLLSAAGEQAIRLLTDSAKTKRTRQDATTGGLADWTLDDADLWDQLLARQVLSGEAAAKLLAAEEAGLRKTEAAHGAAARYRALLDVYRADVYLTGLHLYWSTIEKTLGSRSLTILDPEVSGRQHLMLIDPFDTGNLRNLPPLAPLDDAPIGEQRREEDH